MKVVKTRTGARLLHDGHVVSEVLSLPGPTHSIFDVLAAAVCLQMPPPQRIGMLGFAGGGVLAPLRAMGCDADVHAVDLSLHAEPVFRRLCGPWAKTVHLAEKDALLWLRQGKQAFDVIVEDLSMQIPNDVTKPDISLSQLPEAIAQRLCPEGLVVVNALPVKGLHWRQLTQKLTAPHAEVISISVQGFANRILIAGQQLPPARLVGAQLRWQLQCIGSRLEAALSVRRAR